MQDINKYILINLYNVNTKTELVKILEELRNLLKNLDINPNKQIVLAGVISISPLN